MKRLSFLVILVCLAAAVAAEGQAPAASTAPKPAAQAAPAPSTAKVAVIMFQAAVAQTNEFQRDLADLQKKYDPKRTQLKNLSDEIDKLTKDLQDQGAKLSDE